ncbi:MAG: putative 2-hydroxychromene-2-carboxylate isomerase [Alphaproteobacteria bacterium]|nr:putative 2-hydroxychromene-2-carboxylate isomerase [Alphaproteobacteria bacterium]
MARPVEFWFEFASTYSYLAAERIEQLAAGVPVLWRPFLLGPIFHSQGWNDSPFNIYPVKGNYMWRDMERLAAEYGLQLKRPTAFPRNGLLAARVALAHAEQDWIGAFVRGVYRANFAEDREISDPQVVSSVLQDLKLDPGSILAVANSETNKSALKTQTQRAIKLGLFGAPSFTIGGELFWGNDRLEQALQFARAA